MKIIEGLSDHCVLQRDPFDQCYSQLMGEITSEDMLKVIVKTYAHTIVHSASISNAKFEKLPNGNYSFKAVLVGIPTGGPYQVEINQSSKIVFEDVMVGDLYVLAGQSNMEGIGKLTEKLAPQASTRAFYMNNHWDKAHDPLHDLKSAHDNVHVHINGGDFEPRSQIYGTGPGVAFGQALAEKLQVPIGLIPCAHGGTSMDQWSPHYAHNEGHGLYHMMLDRIRKSGGSVKGLIWYQGCSDTGFDAALAYYNKMTNWINKLRSDLNFELPIVMVQIARTCSHECDAHHWNFVQKSQYILSEDISKLQLVSAIDLEMDDFIHISGKSQNRLGKRCANAMHYLITDNGSPTPKLKKIELERDDEHWNCNIRLTFDHVEGHLISQGRANGFTLTDAFTGEERNIIYHTELCDNQVLLKTTESELDLSNCLLNYGKGFMPYCNIVDAVDCALPALYNLKIKDTKHLSKPCTFAWLSTHKTTLIGSNPALLEALYKSSDFVDFGYYFLNAFHHLNDNCKSIIYHMPFEMPITDNVELLLGGSGNFQIYIDFNLVENIVLHQPISPNQHLKNLLITKGKHILTICYQPSDQHAGILVRFAGQSLDSIPNWLKERFA